MLSAQEMEQAKKAFMKYDIDGSGHIDTVELKSTLESLGLLPTQEELDLMMRQMDKDRSGGIEFAEFLTIIERQKAAQHSREDEADTVEAFVALGGQADKTGSVSVEKLRRTIMEFELTIDIDRLLQEMDKDSSGTVDYAEFRLLLSSAAV